jgi:hypothetical protein
MMSASPGFFSAGETGRSRMRGSIAPSGVSLPRQCDALVHSHETDAVTPLDRPGGWMTADAPETYPSAI